MSNFIYSFDENSTFYILLAVKHCCMFHLI